MEGVTEEFLWKGKGNYFCTIFVTKNNDNEPRMSPLSILQTQFSREMGSRVKQIACEKHPKREDKFFHSREFGV